MTFTVYNSIQLPMRLVDYHTHPVFVWIDLLIWCFFVLELVLGFFTAYIEDNEMVVVVDRSKVQRHHLQACISGPRLPSVLSVLPIDWILMCVNPTWKLVGESASAHGFSTVRCTETRCSAVLFRCLRLLRLYNVYSWLRKAMKYMLAEIYFLQLVGLTFSFVLVTHW